MSQLGFIATLLAVLSVLSALGLIHLQNQINKLRQSQRMLADALSVSLASMIEYIDVLQKEGK